MSVRIEQMIRAARPELTESARERLDERISQLQAEPSAAVRGARLQRVRARLQRAMVSLWAPLKARLRAPRRRGGRWAPARVAMSAGLGALVIVISPPLIASLSSTEPVSGLSQSAPVSGLVAGAEDSLRAGGELAPEEGGITGAAAPDSGDAPDSALIGPSPLPPPVYPPVDDGSGPREVERSASLTVEVSDAQESASEAIQAITALDGITLSSQVQFDGETGAAQMQLQVPSERLDEAISRLSQLGEVSSLSTSAVDITSQLNPVRAQLTENAARRKSLLRQLAHADSHSERIELSRELRINRSERTALITQLDALKARTSFAQISLSLVEPGSAADATSDSASADQSFSPAMAIRWWGGAIGPISGVVVLLSIPAIIAALTWLLARAIQRRRRDR